MKYLILLVDDEEFILDIGQGFLEILGYDVITASSGYAAIEVYKEMKENVSLVILDLSMPGLDGYATFEHLKAINPQIKVLLSTGHNTDDSMQKFLTGGVDGFIQKPYSLKSLSQELNKIFGIGKYRLPDNSILPCVGFAKIKWKLSGD